MLNPLNNISLRKRQLFGGWSSVAEDEQMYPCNAFAEQLYRTALPENDLAGENIGDPANIAEDNDSLSRGPCVRIGPEFQASLEDLNEGTEDDEAKYGELLWDPSVLPPKSVNTFLSDTKDSGDPTPNLVSLPVPRQEVRTKEDALVILHRNGYDLDSAREELKSLPWKDIWTTKGSWSRREVELFSTAMESHYKRFHAIRKAFFPDKSTQEVIEYYYYWKVTTDFETQRDFDEVSSQSEEFDELAARASNSQIMKRKRDALQDPYHSDIMSGWNYDSGLFRRGEFTTCTDECPPLKRSRTDDSRLPSDSFYLKEEDSQIHPFHKNSFSSQNHEELFPHSSDLQPWAEFLTFPLYMSPVSSMIPEGDNFLVDGVDPGMVGIDMNGTRVNGDDDGTDDYTKTSSLGGSDLA